MIIDDTKGNERGEEKRRAEKKKEKGGEEGKGHERRIEEGVASSPEGSNKRVKTVKLVN